MNQQIGKWLMMAGVILFVAGILIYFFHNRLNWLGKLPSDISIERKNFRFYFPIATSIIFSLLLTLIIYIIRKIQ